MCSREIDDFSVLLCLPKIDNFQILYTSRESSEHLWEAVRWEKMGEEKPFCCWPLSKCGICSVVAVCSLCPAVSFYTLVFSPFPNSDVEQMWVEREHRMVQRKPLFIFIILQLKLPSLELTFFAFVLLKEIIAQDIIWINSFQTERCLQKLHFSKTLFSFTEADSHLHV